ncbi:MAG: alcohol dehydrogenase catalytic domain-containing protein, partial [Phenylobacterium sp.]|nr:alcohol dehydrogenase catalytic domain-containing protein [Phenylobacterium sp.]
MMAIAIEGGKGPASALKPVQVPIPEPKDGQILIQVKAAGVNRPDLLQRQGGYPPPPGASDIPGLEIAGTVAALGANVTRFAPGDAVCALVPGGGYAEYCKVHETNALPVPDGFSMVEAAAIPET